MEQVRVRGIRGATIAPADDGNGILEVTRELLLQMAEANGLTKDDIVSVIFTVTPDLHAEFPAKAARALGWADLPLLGAVEMDRPGAPRRCIRVLIHAYTSLRLEEIRHIYLRGAEVLRPDRQGNVTVQSEE
ncbi:MAG TPA: chorismate mutase [Firmicutes bacterium]|jgi:chorismate mutase|nr:chorismate mutase [Bacillota bacterium]HOQ23779.1 chorismate mutase [Bacillota bacterium]HPT66923.1 chorismate mutase [Bacillota bacterium]